MVGFSPQRPIRHGNCCIYTWKLQHTAVNKVKKQMRKIISPFFVEINFDAGYNTLFFQKKRSARFEKNEV